MCIESVGCKEKLLKQKFIKIFSVLIFENYLKMVNIK